MAVAKPGAFRFPPNGSAHRPITPASGGGVTQQHAHVSSRICPPPVSPDRCSAHCTTFSVLRMYLRTDPYHEYAATLGFADIQDLVVCCRTRGYVASSMPLQLNRGPQRIIDSIHPSIRLVTYLPSNNTTISLYPT